MKPSTWHEQMTPDPKKLPFHITIIIVIMTSTLMTNTLLNLVDTFLNPSGILHNQTLKCSISLKQVDKEHEGSSTLDMVSSSGSSCGSAQSTMISHPHTLKRPELNRRLAREAACSTKGHLQHSSVRYVMSHERKTMVINKYTYKWVPDS